VLFSLTKTKTKRVKNEKELISLTKTKTKTKMLQQRKRKRKWAIWYQNENITKSRPKLKLKRKVCNENEIIFVDKASLLTRRTPLAFTDGFIRTYGRLFCKLATSCRPTVNRYLMFRIPLSAELVFTCVTLCMIQTASQTGC